MARGHARRSPTASAAPRRRGFPQATVTGCCQVTTTLPDRAAAEPGGAPGGGAAGRLRPDRRPGRQRLPVARRVEHAEEWYCHLKTTGRGVPALRPDSGAAPVRRPGDPGGPGGLGRRGLSAVDRGPVAGPAPPCLKEGYVLTTFLRVRLARPSPRLVIALLISCSSPSGLLHARRQKVECTVTMEFQGASDAPHRLRRRTEAEAPSQARPRPAAPDLERHERPHRLRPTGRRRPDLSDRTLSDRAGPASGAVPPTRWSCSSPASCWRPR